MLDLAHFGTPTWLPDAFADADFPRGARALRPGLRRTLRGPGAHVCPINEPLITALFCGDIGLWPPYGHGLEQLHDRALARGARVFAGRSRCCAKRCPASKSSCPIRWKSPSPTRISDENSSPFLAGIPARRRRTPDAAPAHRARPGHGPRDQAAPARFLAGEARVLGFRSALVRAQRAADRRHRPGLLRAHRGGALHDPEGYYRQRALQPPMGLYRAAQDYWTRYHIPLMITETSVGGTDADKIALAGAIRRRRAPSARGRVSRSSAIPGGR